MIYSVLKYKTTSKIILLIIVVFLISCKEENQSNNSFLNYIATIPKLELPFITSSKLDLQTKIAIDSTYSVYNSEIQGIYGQRKINDSTYFIINLLASDIVFPELVTYTSRGIKIDQLTLLHCPGGSSGYDERGSSYLFFDKNYNIIITDSIEKFDRDSLGIIIDSTRKNKIALNRYKVELNGQIKKQ